MDPSSFSLSLSLATRLSISITALVFVVFGARALPRGRTFGALLAGPFLIALAFSHVDLLRETLGTTFPIGLGLGLTAALASLGSPGARRAFAALSDRDMRLLLSFRAVFGAQLLALGALGQLPRSFALAAGLGDLVVAWLALASPASLAGDGSRAGRVLVHGLGAVDLVQVVALAVTVVRPWALVHGNFVPMTLPWVAVPLMVAINLHGLYQAWRPTQTQPERARSEPAGRLPGALSRT